MFFDFSLGAQAHQGLPVAFNVSDPAGLADGLELDRKAELASKLGFDCVAVDHEFPSSTSVKDYMASQPGSVSTDALQEVLKSGTILRKSKRKKGQLFRLSRATLSARDVAFASTLIPGGPLRRMFDILTIQPLSNSVLEEACLRLDVDLIYFDLSESLPCKLVISNLAIAIKRGIHFEIDYNPAVRSGDRRTVFFAAAQMVCKALRGRNIIISSRARNAFELRGPYDIINFASLLGLQEADAKAAISSRGLAVLKHASDAKASKGPYTSRLVDKSPEGAQSDQEPKEARPGQEEGETG